MFVHICNWLQLSCQRLLDVSDDDDDDDDAILLPRPIMIYMCGIIVFFCMFEAGL